MAYVAVAELAGHVRPGCGWYAAIAVARSRIVVRSPVPTSSVRRRPAGGLAIGGDQGVGDVVDVDEVTGDLAVLVERDRLALAGQLENSETMPV